MTLIVSDTDALPGASQSGLRHFMASAPSKRLLVQDEPGAIDPELMAHIARLDLLIQHEVHCVNADPNDRLGLASVLLDADAVLEALQEPFDTPYWANKTTDLPDVADSGLVPPVTGRLRELQARFDLSDLERDAVLFSVLPYFDPRYTALYAYVQPYKPNLDWPSTDLVLHLLGLQGTKKIQAKSRLGPASAIFARGLVRSPSTSTLADPLWVMQGIAPIFQFLIGGAPYPAVAGARWRTVESEIEHGNFAAQLSTALRKSGEQWPVVLLRAGVKDDPAELLVDMAQRLGHPTLEICALDLPDSDLDAASVLQSVARDACLWNACLLIEADSLTFVERALSAGADAERMQASTRINQIHMVLQRHPGPVVILERGDTVPLRVGVERPHISLQMPERTFEEDAANAARILQSSQLAVDISKDALQTLLLRFRPDAGSFALALREADAYRRCEDGQTHLGESHLRRALNLRARNDFGKLARRTTPQRDFSDLVMAPQARTQMREVAAAIRFRDTALERGFARKLGRHTGISVLFHGPSGTGKSMAAEVLANELGVDLIRVDLSTVVNKFIGETEKNLSRIFDLAAADAGVLFFDEADALFGKRTETKDAHDRHANIEVSYLLQRVESHPGLVVLSTNFREHLDDAFTRRLTFDIEFPFPDLETRERLWSTMFPGQFALSDDISPLLLARRAEVAGGNIRNIALLASWLMLAEGAERIAWSHIDQAIQREFAKMGRAWYPG